MAAYEQNQMHLALEHTYMERKDQPIFICRWLLIPSGTAACTTEQFMRCTYEVSF